MSSVTLSEETVISADSHIAETEAVFADIDPKFEEDRPRQIFDDEAGALLAIPNIDIKIPMGVICTAGRAPEKFGEPVPWEKIHPAGFDPKARLKIQDEESIDAEVLYPSVGMVICNHPDINYKKACFDAYNRWLAEFCEAAPDRLLGMAMAAVRTIEEGVEELRTIKKMGFRGVMLPGSPEIEDYDHPCYDPLWEAAVDLGLPVCFHILTSKGDITDQFRGPNIVQQIVTVRGNQNILMMFVFGGVFERFPELKIVLVESDAGWIPHFKFRMDHAWERHRFWMQSSAIQRKPSTYVDEHVYVTFQDDYSVKHVTEALNMERVLWASDFPHSDGTYPNSRAVIDHVTEGMSAGERRGVLADNVRSLYGLS